MVWRGGWSEDCQPQFQSSVLTSNITKGSTTVDSCSVMEDSLWISGGHWVTSRYKGGRRIRSFPIIEGNRWTKGIMRQKAVTLHWNEKFFVVCSGKLNSHSPISVSWMIQFNLRIVHCLCTHLFLIQIIPYLFPLFCVESCFNLGLFCDCLFWCVCLCVHVCMCGSAWVSVYYCQPFFIIYYISFPFIHPHFIQYFFTHQYIFVKPHENIDHVDLHECSDMT